MHNLFIVSSLGNKFSVSDAADTIGEQADYSWIS